MKRALPGLVGRKISQVVNREPRKGTPELASAVKAAFEQLELRQMLSVSANPGGPYTVNEGASVVIGGSASGATTYQYKWDLNYDGSHFHTQATGQAFSFHVTDGPASRTVALKVVNQGNPFDFDVQTTTLTINNVAPTMTVTGASTIQAGGLYILGFSATDPGTDTISQWSIDWGDGTADTVVAGNVNSVNHTFASAGTPTVTVTATDEDGSYDKTKGVTVNGVTPIVTATGDASSDEGDAYTVNFSSTLSNIRNGWIVDWGDDSDSEFFDTSASSEDHTFVDNGNFTITVTAITDDTESSDTVDVTVNNIAPSVAVTGGPVGSSPEGTELNFGGTISDPGTDDTLTKAWSVTKGGVSYSLPGGTVTNDDTLAFTPRDNGSYVVNLMVTDKDGAATSDHTSAITVTNVAPTANITGAPMGAIDEGDAVSLTVDPSDAGADDTFTYEWSVTRNNSFYTLMFNVATDEATLNFTPDDEGSYVATCVVSDDEGATVSVHTAAIVVNNADPDVTIDNEPVGHVNEGTAIDLGADASDPGTGDTLTIEWSVTRDGNPFTLPNGTDTQHQAFSFTPTDNGTYVVTAVVEDNDSGSTSVHTADIIVDNVDPTANITGAPDSSPEATEITATAHASDASSVDTFDYAWAVTKNGNPYDLPMDAVTDEQTFSFTPMDNGTYLILLTVTDDDNGSVDAEAEVAVTDVAPTGNITGAPTNSPEATAIDLLAHPTDAGAGDTFTYAWSVTRNGSVFILPGGTVTSTAAFNFTPTDNGNYVGTVRISDDDGADADVSTNTIEVTNVAPTGSISGEPVGHVDEGDTVSLSVSASDVSGVDTLTYAWSVEKDGEAYSLPEDAVTDQTSFEFVARDDGSYVATCVVTDDDNGALTLTSDTILVDNVDPTASISGQPDFSLSEGTAVTLTANPSDAGADDTSTYSWSVTKGGEPLLLGEDVVTNEAEFTAVPPDEGTYIATVVVTDKDGGDVSVQSGEITVTNANPTASIVGLPEENASDEGAQLHLTAEAEDAGAIDVLSYDWHVTKDGEPFAGNDTADFNFTPDDQGTYVVSLTVTDDDGGETTVEPETINVTGVAPTPEVSVLPKNILEGDEVNLISVVTDPSSADTGEGFEIEWMVTKGGDQFAVGTGAEIAFTPDDNGSYTLTAIATDKDGLESSDTVEFAVGNVAPAASITGAPTEGPEGTSITFGSDASDASPRDEDEGFTYAWSVKKDGSTFSLPNNAVTNDDGFTFKPTDNGSYKVTLTVTDKDGGAKSVNKTINVTNVAPGSVAIAGAPASAAEGTQINVTGSATDVSSEDTLAYAWTVKKDGKSFAAGKGAGFHFTPTDNGSFVVSLVVTDDDGGTSSPVTKTITVSNVAPTGTFVVAATGVVGTTTNVTATVTDPGSADTETVSVNWGDGTATETFNTTAGGALNLTHVYGSANTFPVTMTITDDDGGKSKTIKSSITTKGFALQPDPMDGTKTALVVAGTDADDNMKFSVNENGRIKATVNGVLMGTFAPTGHLIVYAGGGSNTIIVDKGVKAPAVIYGGGGKDVLAGGHGDDIIVGRRGNDVISGNGGRDILIGGVGADVTEGGEGDDILMGGSTAGSESFAALGAIQAEWVRQDAIFTNRVKHLKGILAGGLNGSNKLTDGTVFEDANPDVLAGGANSDWFFTQTTAGSGEVVKDLNNSQDIVTNVVVGISTKPPVKKA